MLMSVTSNMTGKTKSTTYAADRSSTSPDYRSESSSTSPLHMTNLESSNRSGGSIGNGGGGIVNGHDVTTLTSALPRSNHYTNHNNNNVIKESMVSNNTSNTAGTETAHRNNVNSIYSLDHGGINTNTIPYNSSSRRVPDVHTNLDSYDNASNDYKVLSNANSENCHELKKWSDVSSVDKIAMSSKNFSGRSDQDTKINGLDNSKRRSNCNNDTNNNSNDNHSLPR